MGSHTCEWCKREGRLNQSGEMEYSPYSSADVVLVCTETGMEWVFPWVGLPHYVKEHRYQPPLEFVRAVMEGTLKEGNYYQTKGGTRQDIGFLCHPHIETGNVPDDFLARLKTIVDGVQQHAYLGMNTGFVQYRGQ